MDNKKNGIPKLRFPGFTGAWEQRKLGEVVNFLDTLRKPLEGAKRVKGPYPYYGASGIVDYVDGYLFDEELILLSEDGANITERNYPVCFLASGKYWVNNHAHVLKIKEDNDNNFICNSLERKDYTKYNTGMAMPKLNKETCKGIPIMCPNYDEQKKIGNYFRKFDTLIALHQRKLEHLQEQKKGLLQKMFPKNGEVVPEVRFPGFTDDWEQRKLRKTNTFFTDGNYGEAYPKSSDMTNSNDGVPFLTGGNLKDGQIDITDVNYITKKKHEELTSGHLIEDDIIIAVRGSLGALGYVNKKNIDWNINSQLAILRTNKTELIGKYLLQFLLSSRGQIELTKRQTGSALKQLPIKALKDINIPITSIREQQKIGQFFNNLDSLITLHQRKLEHLELMKKGLLQQMFV